MSIIQVLRLLACVGQSHHQPASQRNTNQLTHSGKVGGGAVSSSATVGPAWFARARVIGYFLGEIIECPGEGQGDSYGHRIYSVCEDVCIRIRWGHQISLIVRSQAVVALNRW